MSNSQRIAVIAIGIIIGFFTFGFIKQNVGLGIIFGIVFWAIIIIISVWTAFTRISK
jgi:hypothetical protein